MSQTAPTLEAGTPLALIQTEAPTSVPGANTEINVPSVNTNGTESGVSPEARADAAVLIEAIDKELGTDNGASLDKNQAEQAIQNVANTSKSNENAAKPPNNEGIKLAGGEKLGELQNLVKNATKDQLQTIVNKKPSPDTVESPNDITLRLLAEQQLNAPTKVLEPLSQFIPKNQSDAVKRQQAELTNQFAGAKATADMRSQFDFDSSPAIRQQQKDIRIRSEAAKHTADIQRKAELQSAVEQATKNLMKQGYSESNARRLAHDMRDRGTLYPTRENKNVSQPSPKGEQLTSTQNANQEPIDTKIDGDNIIYTYADGTTKTAKRAAGGSGDPTPSSPDLTITAPSSTEGVTTSATNETSDTAQTTEPQEVVEPEVAVEENQDQTPTVETNNLTETLDTAQNKRLREKQSKWIKENPRPTDPGEYEDWRDSQAEAYGEMLANELVHKKMEAWDQMADLDSIDDPEILTKMLQNRKNFKDNQIALIKRNLGMRDGSKQQIQTETDTQTSEIETNDLESVEENEDSTQTTSNTTLPSTVPPMPQSTTTSPTTVAPAPPAETKQQPKDEDKKQEQSSQQKEIKLNGDERLHILQNMVRNADTETLKVMLSMKAPEGETESQAMMTLKLLAKDRLDNPNHTVLEPLKEYIPKESEAVAREQKRLANEFAGAKATAEMRSQFNFDSSPRIREQQKEIRNQAAGAKATAEIRREQEILNHLRMQGMNETLANQKLKDMKEKGQIRDEELPLDPSKELQYKVFLRASDDSQLQSYINAPGINQMERELARLAKAEKELREAAKQQTQPTT